ncbi:AbiJ-NTD4 domain-containing protein [Flavobacterium sp. LB2P74]|uniref:AbiJ-NTD4 domain-containing protein n=1 Tax=Flavobacterium sp. LB2P74 TaxID=3401717 RepID=UPI003AAAEA9D
MRFSQRIGQKPEKKEIQIEDIDLELRIRLWNIITIFIFDQLDDNGRNEETTFRTFSKTIYHDFFKYPLDALPIQKREIIERLKKYFFDFKWYEVYDFIEFIISFDENDLNIEFDVFIDSCNNTFESEFSAYRIVDNQIAPITNEIEIMQIETAIEKTHQYTSYVGSNIHLQKALEMLSNKTNPDYRNSIKESISAVESISKIISNNNKDSLGGALDKIKGKLKIHPSLEKGFKQLYGYTSDSGGIRHSLMDHPDCAFEDALFMLVSSSAFINYLIAKTEKAGIKVT